MKKLLTLLLCALLTRSFGAAQEKSGSAAGQGLRVEKGVAATSVENRGPVGESKEFEASVGTVYCWTKIAATTVPATIKHVWYIGDQKVFEKALEIKYPSTRTWSSKSVKAGNWRVEVTDDAGAVLSSVSFTVK
jgi:hypothetical protein